MITFINVFTVEPQNQPRLVEILSKVTAERVSKADGFIAAALHRGTDKTSVAMYAQWRSAADYEAMRHDPLAQAALAEALSIASFAPGQSEIVRTFPPGA